MTLLSDRLIVISSLNLSKKREQFQSKKMIE